MLEANVAGAKEIVRRLPPTLRTPVSRQTAVARRPPLHAIVTAPGAITPEARQRLRALHGREI